jgi:lysophospholipase L1-like esterase
MKFFILFLLIVTFFIYGLLIGTKHIFPYKVLISLKDNIKKWGGYEIYQPWDKKYSEHYYNKNTQYEMLQNKMKYKIVMLGDSITEQANWNELLERNDIANRGISGDTSDGLLARMNTISDSYTKAFIMIGVNDFSKKQSVEFVFNNYKKIIDYLNNKGIRIYIQSTIFTGKQRARLHNDKIEKLNNLLKQYSLDNNYQYIDINQILTQKNLLEEKYSFDGLHLNGNGLAEWAEILKSKLEDNK